MTITTDPHAKRRQADGRNAWRKMALTPGAQGQFVRWMLENGLRDILISEKNRQWQTPPVSVDPWGKIEDDS